MAYGRAAYFCIFCALIWLLELLLRRTDLPVSTLYGVTIVCHDTLLFLRDVLVGRPGHTHARFFLRSALKQLVFGQGSPTASRWPF